jgi:hypothetical protein
MVLLSPSKKIIPRLGHNRFLQILSNDILSYLTAFKDAPHKLLYQFLVSCIHSPLQAAPVYWDNLLYNKKEIVKQRKWKSGHGHQRGPTPRRTGRLTVGSNITWTWTWRKLSAWGYNWTTLFLGDINTGTWPSRLRGVSDETVIHGHGSCATITSGWLQCKLQTHPLVREGALHEEERNCQTTKIKIWPWATTARRTGRLTVSSNITCTWRGRNYYQGTADCGVEIIGRDGYRKRSGASAMELVSSPSVKSCCGWGTGTVRELKGRGTSTVGSRYQRIGEGKQTEKTQCKLNKLLSVKNRE